MSKVKCSQSKSKISGDVILAVSVFFNTVNCEIKVSAKNNFTVQHRDRERAASATIPRM